MLSIIPTPIGNLDDITLRTIKTLEIVDFLLVEDTRVTSKLLNHLGISKKMIAFHNHNEHFKLQGIIDDLKLGKHIGLVSDAGTPAISDPGFLLVRECIKNNILIQSLPGPTAFVPALTLSGLPTDEFLFVGFLPRKKGRKSKLEKLAQVEQTIIIYESPFRVVATLNDLSHYLGEREVSVSRELSKKFEQTIRGVITDVILHFENNQPKGEFVICVSGKK